MKFSQLVRKAKRRERWQRFNQFVSTFVHESLQAGRDSPILTAFTVTIAVVRCAYFAAWLAFEVGGFEEWCLAVVRTSMHTLGYAVGVWIGVNVCIGLLATIRKRKPDAPTTLIPRYVDNCIEEMRDNVIGPKSKFAKVLEQMEARRTTALRLRVQLELRTRENPSDFLKKAQERADDVVQKSERALDRLREFRASVEAHVTELRYHLKDLDPALRDLELIREVETLVNETKDIEEQAECVIADAVNELRARMASIHREVEGQFIAMHADLLLEDPTQQPGTGLYAIRKKSDEIRD